MKSALDTLLLLITTVFILVLYFIQYVSMILLISYAIIFLIIVILKEKMHLNKKVVTKLVNTKSESREINYAEKHTVEKAVNVYIEK